MKQESFSISSTDAHTINIYKWMPATRKKLVGAIHISHGMAEYGLRYEQLANSLCAAGFVVFAHDHRGHGPNTGPQDIGHYADENGWDKVIEDLSLVQNYIEDQHPDLPRFLLGHSMGSFITMAYLMTHPTTLSGVIFSGSNYESPLRLKALLPILKMEQLRIGKKGRSKLVEHLTFGSFNNAFQPATTEYDWLSKDPEQVNQYINDPLCGFFCTNQLWEDLVGALIHIYTPASFRKIRANLPFYLFAGDRDPVGHFGKGVKNLAKTLIDTGHTDVSLQLYPNGRHEMINEVNRDEVIQNLVHWLSCKA